MDQTLLTLEDVLAGAQAAGIDLSERTFRYYAVLGLLPRPVRRPSGAEDARVAWYPVTIMQRLQDIRSLQAQGYSLKQIKQSFSVKDVSPLCPEASEAPAPASVAGTDVLGFVRAVAASAVVEAGRRYLVDATLHPDETGLRRAAVRYYEDLVVRLLGASALVATRSALASMAPLELETLFTPLRAWRDHERARRLESGRRALACAELLRQVASEFECGPLLSAATVQALEVELSRLTSLRHRLDAMGAGGGVATAMIGMARRLVDSLVDLLGRALSSAEGGAGELSGAHLARAVASTEESLFDLVRAVDALERLLARKATSLPAP